METEYDELLSWLQGGGHADAANLVQRFVDARAAPQAPPPAQTPPFPTTVVSEQLSPPPALGGTRPAATAEATPSPPPATATVAAASG